MIKAQPTQTKAGPGFSEAKSGPTEEQPGIITTALGINRRRELESITSTTQSPKVNFPIAGGKQVKQINSGCIDSMDVINHLQAGPESFQ